MSSQFIPTSYYTVQFAKDYRAEQARAAERACLLAALKASRQPSRIRRAWTAVVTRARQTIPGAVPRDRDRRATALAAADASEGSSKT